MITATVIAFATPAVADISDYESMHKRLAAVLDHERKLTLHTTSL